jgi:pyruvate/2-oxoglutarate dehydrogenase complex dihydrolipoamide acyltransferase (E2) component
MARRLCDSGKAGRILKEDVLAYLEGATAADAPPALAAAATPHAPPPPSPLLGGPPPSDRTEAVSALQKVMIKTMTAANAVPHFTYCDEIDVSALVELRAKLQVRLLLCGGLMNTSTIVNHTLPRGLGWGGTACSRPPLCPSPPPDHTTCVCAWAQGVAEAAGLRRLTYMPFVIKAASMALQRYPILNATVNDADGAVRGAPAWHEACG